MKIQDLQNNQKVNIRLGNAGESSVIWGPWFTSSLYVQRNKKGKVIIITPTGIVQGAWAEYSPEDYNPHYKVFECEGYYMEVEGLEP